MDWQMANVREETDRPAGISQNGLGAIVSLAAAIRVLAAHVEECFTFTTA